MQSGGVGGGRECLSGNRGLSLYTVFLLEEARYRVCGSCLHVDGGEWCVCVLWLQRWISLFFLD